MNYRKPTVRYQKPHPSCPYLPALIEFHWGKPFGKFIILNFFAKKFTPNEIQKCGAGS
jgi:hypothetical protein